MKIMSSSRWTISKDGNTPFKMFTYFSEFKRPSIIHISPGPDSLIHPQIRPLLLFACKYLSSYRLLFGLYKWVFWWRSVWKVFSSEKIIRLQSETQSFFFFSFSQKRFLRCNSMMNPNIRPNLANFYFYLRQLEAQQ